MAERRIGPILAEIIEALDGIAAATSGKTLDDFRSDWLLRRGFTGAQVRAATRFDPDD